MEMWLVRLQTGIFKRGISRIQTARSFLLL